MTDKRVVLVTGVAGFWGQQAALRLLAGENLHVIGLDTQAPAEEIKGLDFIQANVRNPLLRELCQEERVDTVCHLAFVDSLRPNESAFDANVMGSAQFLAACAAAGVRKVVVRSSTMVYGAQATNSAFLREDQPLRGCRSYGYLRDLVEQEAHLNGFRAQHPNIIVTLLRLAHVVGPKVDSPMTRFLRDEEALVLMGFDPMMQIIHEADAIGALVHAVQHDVPGVFNVAAEGVMPLWRLMGLASKVAMPMLHPLAYLSVQMLGTRNAPIDLDYLRYPCVGDLAKMRAELSFVPQYTAEETLREFAAQQRLQDYLPESAVLAYDQERLRDTIERRRRARLAEASSDGAAPSKRAARKPRKPRRAPPPAVAAPQNGQVTVDHEEAVNG